MRYVELVLPFDGTSPAREFMDLCRNQYNLDMVFEQPVTFNDAKLEATFRVNVKDASMAEITYACCFEEAALAMIAELKKIRNC